MEPQKSADMDKIFTQAIDQGYEQEESEEKFIELNSQNLYLDLTEDGGESTKTPKESRRCFDSSVNLKPKNKKKFKFKYMLKTKWEEKISLMKTNCFLSMKGLVQSKISHNEILTTKICEILRSTLILYIKRNPNLDSTPTSSCSGCGGGNSFQHTSFKHDRPSRFCSNETGDLSSHFVNLKISDRK